MHFSPFYLFIFLLHILQAELEPISIYHPTAEEVSAAISTPIEGFFDGADVVAEAMAPAAPAITQGVPVETPIPSTKPGLVKGGAQTEGVSELLSFPSRLLLPRRELLLQLLPRLRLPFLPHLLLSLSAILLRLYLRP